jgi:hypothetical protein
MTSEITKIASLSSGCRGLLVAMICHGNCETFTAKGCSSGESGPVPMNKSQIRSSFVTMIEVKRKIGGIKIGHEVNEMNVMSWINELHDCSLIKGGKTSAFTGGKGDMVKLNAAILYLIVTTYFYRLLRRFFFEKFCCKTNFVLYLIIRIGSLLCIQLLRV